MLNKFFLLIVSLAFFSINGFAQKTAEVGIFIGRSYYNGEVNPTTHVGDNVGSLTYGGVFRYNLNPRYSLRASLVRTELGGDDQSAGLLFNTARDVSFETSLTDFTGSIEFNFLPYELGSKKYFFSPYLFVGLSVYNYDPVTKIAGVEIEREETEGATKIAIPFGPGIKLSLGSNLGIALEWGFRKTFNDAIDGLPNRELEIYEQGKTYDNDWYVVSGVVLTYRITKISPCPYYRF